MEEPQLTRDLLQNRQELLGFIFALTRDFDAAEEIFQEVALGVLREASSGRKVDAFLPWGREVARRRVAEYFRKASQARRIIPLPESTANLVSRCFEENEADESSSRLRLKYLLHCLEGLPSRARQLIELKYKSRMGVEEIAAGVSWTAASVSSALFKARKALLQCISNKFRLGEVT